jgi:hypothetical protein
MLNLSQSYFISAEHVIAVLSCTTVAPQWREFRPEGLLFNYWIASIWYVGDGSLLHELTIPWAPQLIQFCVNIAQHYYAKHLGSWTMSPSQPLVGLATDSTAALRGANWISLGHDKRCYLMTQLLIRNQIVPSFRPDKGLHFIRFSFLICLPLVVCYKIFVCNTVSCIKRKIIGVIINIMVMMTMMMMKVLLMCYRHFVPI